MYVIYNEEAPGVGDVITVMSHVWPEQEVPNAIHTEDELREPLNIPGMVPDLKIKLDTGEFIYKYNAVETLESKVQAIENTLPALQQAVDELILGGAI